MLWGRSWGGEAEDAREGGIFDVEKAREAEVSWQTWRPVLLLTLSVLELWRRLWSDPVKFKKVKDAVATLWRGWELLLTSRHLWEDSGQLQCCQ